MKTTLKLTLAALAGAAMMSGCATNDQGVLVIDQGKVTAVIAALNPPPPPPSPVVVVEEGYQPVPTDVYVATVVDSDVVMYHGDTYIWVVKDGVRHRQFYAHGDHREDVFHRRDELHHVMEAHGGRLPDHAIMAQHGPEHPGAGMPGHPGPAGAPIAHAAVPPRPAPAPAAKPVAAKETKKS
ncbi:hypothetical protein [Paraburkholderia sp. DHOC27]|uniref:hypothetical protein n=1 Tax=Paraburkholderia sp. DHOC27 TaxID=2303330 RepID=UPI000E3EE1F9|nr:hypothetical protein [Paraburkholderia sp. DHOC27]RFU44457.1 hypothetical protein D0B32_28020 [Paraburkholderia sp. DHOC27]